MKRFGIIGLAALAMVALVAIVGFADGEKKADVEKDKKVTAEKSGKVCPVTGEAIDYTCSRDARGTAGVAVGEGESHLVMRTISVQGMTCTGCEKAVSASLAELPGVFEVVKVCHKSAEALVKVDPEAVKDDALVMAVSRKGYDAEIVPAVARTAEAGAEDATCAISARASGDKACCAGKSTKVSAGTKAEEPK
ncbi:MAG: cation transporter [Candidatus Zixiibacteriota bacterium]|nr:MAG: cation transporter [candidate division Zixibacteria bacterium]